MARDAESSECRLRKAAVIVVSCSGASNAGQIANAVARRLDASGDAKFYSLAGIAANVPEMIQTVREASKVLVIDGCATGCGKKCMDRAGLTGYAYLVVAEHGVVKRYTLDVSEVEVSVVIAACRRLIPTGAKGKPCCCDGQ